MKTSIKPYPKLKSGEEAAKCRRCGGTGFRPDGEVCSGGGCRGSGWIVYRVQGSMLHVRLSYLPIRTKLAATAASRFIAQAIRAVFLLALLLHGVTFADAYYYLNITCTGQPNQSEDTDWRAEFRQGSPASSPVQSSAFDLRSVAEGGTTGGMTVYAGSVPGSWSTVEVRLVNPTRNYAGAWQLFYYTVANALTAPRGASTSKYCFTPSYRNTKEFACVYTVGISGVQVLSKGIDAGESWQGSQICAANEAAVSVSVSCMYRNSDGSYGLGSAESIPTSQLGGSTTSGTAPAYDGSAEVANIPKYDATGTNGQRILFGTNVDTSGFNAVYAGLENVRAAVEKNAQDVVASQNGATNPISSLFVSLDRLKTATDTNGNALGNKMNAIKEAVDTNGLAMVRSITGLTNGANSGLHFATMSNDLAWGDGRNAWVEGQAGEGRSSIEGVKGLFEGVDTSSSVGNSDSFFVLHLPLLGTTYDIDCNPMHIDGVPTIAEWARRVFKFWIVLAACMKILRFTDQAMNTIFGAEQMRGPLLQGSDATGITAQLANITSKGIAITYLLSFFILAAALPISLAAWFDNGIVSSSLANPYIGNGGIVGAGLYLMDQFFPIQTALWAAIGVALYKVTMSAFQWVLGSTIKAMVGAFAILAFTAASADAGKVTLRNFSGENVLWVSGVGSYYVRTGDTFEIYAPNTTEFHMTWGATDYIMTHTESEVSGFDEVFNVGTNAFAGGPSIVSQRTFSDFQAFMAGIVFAIPCVGVWWAARMAVKVPSCE